MLRDTPSNMKQLAHDVNGLMACAQLSVDSLAGCQDSLARKRALQLQNVIDNTVRYCREIMVTTKPEERTEVSLEAIFANVNALLSPLSSSADVRIHMESSQVCIPAESEILLHRALTNLGRNAIAAMQNTKGRNLTFKVWGPPALIWIDVCDEGPGLGSDAMHLLHCDTSRTITKNGRTRFGLRTTAVLASQLGGEVHVVKTGCTGTTIRISIPRPSKTTSNMNANSHA